MSIQRDITIMVDRLRRADIPMDRLCYQLNEWQWMEFTAYMQAVSKYHGADLSYIKDCTYMGLRIRKYTDLAAEDPTP